MLGFFPLDEQLGLLPGSLSPRLSEALVRLSTWIPSFDHAARELAYFTGATVSKSTAVRRTQAAGAAALAVHQAEVDLLLREYPPAPAGPEALVLSVDGAMVPLVHGEWTEVKTLAIGTPSSVKAADGTPTVQTSTLSYFSRATDSETFAQVAVGEVQRRGVERAERVAAVSDGAEWIQGFVDLHAPAAVRILDFPHAASYIATIGQTLEAGQRLLSEEAVGRLLHRLKHEGPSEVLAELRCLGQAHPGVVKPLAYLEKREAQLQYARFQAEGWPLGSGMVESANKLVVEARLKGAGMHWAPEHVDPMLALRNAVCNDRWEEVWGQIEAELRRQVVAQRGERQKKRLAQQTVEVPGPEQASAAGCPPVEVERKGCAEVIAQVRAELQQSTEVHPWRRAWSRRQQAVQASAA